MLVDLIDVELPTELDRMISDNLRERIAAIERIVPLIRVRDRHAHHKRRKHKIHDAFILRRLHVNSR